MQNCREKLRRWFGSALAGSGCLLLFSGLTAAEERKPFAGADPHVLAVNGEFWLYPTEPNARRLVFAAYRSKDLRQWRRSGEVLDLAKVPWVKEDQAPWHGAWAPALAEKNGRFYFYYSVGPQNPTPSRIGVAVGDSPAGPFRDSGKPLLTGGSGFEAIDPMVYVDPRTQKAWLYAGGSAGAKLRVFELEEDMVRLRREITVTQPEFFTEGPFLHERKGIYYLSYSHGRWNDPSYSVHYATGNSPVGPWTYQGKILESDARFQGPGHHAFVQKPGMDQWFIVYHRWETERKKPPLPGTRRLAVEKIAYDAQGRIQPIRMGEGNVALVP